MSDSSSVSSTGPRWRRPHTVSVRSADGELVAHDVTVADGLGSRLVGLMGRTRLDPKEGLWLLPCNSVPMFFMRTRLDIVYLDRQQRVVLCVPEMREWTVRLLPVRHAHSALELAPGTLSRHGIKDGDQLKIETEPVIREEVQLEMAAAGSDSLRS
jgi:uncharacterized membrane protein (UPF0127 family)